MQGFPQTDQHQALQQTNISVTHSTHKLQYRLCAPGQISYKSASTKSRRSRVHGVSQTDTTVHCYSSSLVEIYFAVITIIVLATSQQWLSTPPPDRQQRRSGRLFAKHYMEGDLLTPPETDDVRELRKKQS